jgi:hypothetical protein
MSDEVLFTCSICEKQFPADPDTMLSVEYEGFHISEEDAEKLELGLITEDEAKKNAEADGAPKCAAGDVPDELKETAECICMECQKNPELWRDENGNPCSLR